MRLKNTTHYPTDEVRALVAFGMRGVRTNRLAVHVKNGRAGSSGRAYTHGVPAVSPRSRQRSVDRLVVLRIGPPDSFPYSNMVRSYRRTRWVDVFDCDFTPTGKPDGDDWYLDTIHGPLDEHGHNPVIRYRWERTFMHPYGGVKSPLIVAADWREGLVSIAAHEARHVYQAMNGKRASEVDCERFAAKRLAAYREQEAT